jgi:hypothetical protein
VVTTDILGDYKSSRLIRGQSPAKFISIRAKFESTASHGLYLVVAKRSGTAIDVSTYAGLGDVRICMKADPFGRPTPGQHVAQAVRRDPAMRDGSPGLSMRLAVARAMVTRTGALIAV